MLTDAQVEKYRALYRKRFGKEISKEDAFEQGTRFVRLVELIRRPMATEEYKAIPTRHLEKSRATNEPP